MKSIFKVSLLAATVALAVGCQKEETKPEPAPAVEEVQQAEAVAFKTEDEKAAYAIGASFANYLSASLDKPSEIGINLDKALVLKGIEDVFADSATLSEEEIRGALEALDKRVAETMQAQAAEKSRSSKESWR